MREIQSKVTSILIQAAKTQEEAIALFAKTIITEFKWVSQIGNKTAAVIHQLTNLTKYIDNKIENSELFIDAFNKASAEIALQWTKLADQWISPKTIENKEILIEDLQKFQQKISNEIKEITDCAAEHINVLHSLNQQNPSKEQTEKIKSVKARIQKIILFDYKKLINDLKSGTISEV
jgi:hypothetical protein